MPKEYRLNNKERYKEYYINNKEYKKKYQKQYKKIKMTTIKERQNFPIRAGMPFNNPKDYKIKKVGFRTVEFTYFLHPDGDKQLQGEKEIKRTFY